MEQSVMEKQDSREKEALWVSVYEAFEQSFGLEPVDVKTYSPLALAYLGDTVYDMIFKTIVVSRHNMAAHKYHKKVCQYVSAVAQSQMVEVLLDLFTEEELLVYKRGRNSKPYNKAKNASPIEYQRATGLESLMGYLYLSRRIDRIIELLREGLQRLETGEQHGEERE